MTMSQLKSNFASPQLPQYYERAKYYDVGQVSFIYFKINTHNLTHLFVMLHAGPKTNILPHLPLKFVGYKYFYWKLFFFLQN